MQLEYYIVRLNQTNVEGILQQSMMTKLMQLGYYMVRSGMIKSERFDHSCDQELQSKQFILDLKFRIIIFTSNFFFLLRSLGILQPPSIPIEKKYHPGTKLQTNISDYSRKNHPSSSIVHSSACPLDFAAYARNYKN